MAEAASQVFRPNHPHATSALHREKAPLVNAVVTSGCALLASHSGAQMFLPTVKQGPGAGAWETSASLSFQLCACAQAASNFVQHLRQPT